MNFFPHDSPYEIQIEFIEKMIYCLDNGINAIFESPTGTGKTTSLLCASLAWQQRQKRIPILSDSNSNSNSHVRSKRSNGRKERIKEKFHENDDQLNLLLEMAENSSSLSDKDDEDGLVGVGKGTLPKIYYCSRTHSQLDQVLRELREIIEKYRDRHQMNNHGNLKSVDKNANFNNENSFILDNDYHAIILASRKHLCIHPQLANHSNLDEKCHELVGGGRGRAIERKVENDEKSLNFNFSKNLIGKRIKIGNGNGGNNYGNDGKWEMEQDNDRDKDKEGNHSDSDKETIIKESKEIGGKCPFYSKNSFNFLQLKRSIMENIQIVDIESVVQVGRKLESCPYYGLRNVGEMVEFIALPYQMILQSSSRKANNIDLRGAVVIFDEAHNLISAINDMQSVIISRVELENTKSLLQSYWNRYQGRLKRGNFNEFMHVERLLHSLTRLCGLEKWKNESREKENGEGKWGKKEIWSVNELLYELGIDNINYYPIQEYVESSHLAFKLQSRGEWERGINKEGGKGINGMNTWDGSCLIEAMKFFISLQNNSQDGRVIMTGDTIKYLSLNPKKAIRDLFREEQCHSIILSGGTMTPKEDILELFSASDGDGNEYEHGNENSNNNNFNDIKNQCEFYSFNHLIPKENCIVFTLKSGPLARNSFRITFENRGNEELLIELGQLVSNFSQIVPNGMVIFVPSYGFLERVKECWSRNYQNHQEDWKNQNFSHRKFHKPIFYESESGESCLISTLNLYRQKAIMEEGAILVGVIGGKLSEGINFNDELGRMVIIIGMPFPNVQDPEVQERIKYHSEKELKRKRKKLKNIKEVETETPSPFQESKIEKQDGKCNYLENICLRSVNQTIGRAIRHANDFASILLIDERYCQERIQKKLSRWIQNSLQIDIQDFPRTYKRIAQFFKNKSK